jgi:hypothetical protein
MLMMLSTSGEILDKFIKKLLVSLGSAGAMVVKVIVCMSTDPTVVRKIKEIPPPSSILLKSQFFIVKLESPAALR